MSETKPSSSIQVKFLKIPKVLKSVIVPGFEPLEKKESKQTVPSKQPPNKSNDIVFDTQFFEERPEEIMSIPSMDLEFTENEERFESKQENEEDDVEEDMLTQEIEKLRLKPNTSTTEPQTSMAHSTKVNYKDRLPVQHIKPNVIKSLVENYNPADDDALPSQTHDQTKEIEEKSSTQKSGFSNDQRINEEIEAFDDNDIDLDLWLTTAINSAEQQQYQRALQYFDRILFIQPTNYLCYEYKAQIYLELGMFVAAIKAIESSIQCNPNWYVSHHTRARCQREMGEIELSFQSYQQCYDLYRQQHSEETVENSPFLLDLNKEIEDVRSLLQDLQQKQQQYFDLMQASISEENEEVNRCFFNLSQRARSRKQLESIQKDSASLSNAKTN